MQQWRKERSSKENKGRTMMQTLELLRLVGEKARLGTKRHRHQTVQKSSP